MLSNEQLLEEQTLLEQKLSVIKKEIQERNLKVDPDLYDNNLIKANLHKDDILLIHTDIKYGTQHFRRLLNDPAFYNSFEKKANIL